MVTGSPQTSSPLPVSGSSASSPPVITIARSPGANRPPTIAPLPGSSASYPLTIQVAGVPSAGTPEPHWTAYVQAISTPIIAIIAAGITTYLAWRQWRTAQNKLNFDLFQRRVTAYREARLMVLRVARDKPTFEEQLAAFDEAVQGARWLFDEKVEKELSLLRASAMQMSGLTPLYSINGPQQPPTFSGQIDKLNALQHDVEELKVLDELFDPFMTLHPDGLWRSIGNWLKKAPDRGHLTLASKRYLDKSYVPDVDLDDY